MSFRYIYWVQDKRWVRMKSQVEVQLEDFKFVEDQKMFDKAMIQHSNQIKKNKVFHKLCILICGSEVLEVIVTKNKLKVNQDYLYKKVLLIGKKIDCKAVQMKKIQMKDLSFVYKQCSTPLLIGSAAEQLFKQVREVQQSLSKDSILNQSMPLPHSQSSSSFSNSQINNFSLGNINQKGLSTSVLNALKKIEEDYELKKKQQQRKKSKKLKESKEQEIIQELNQDQYDSIQNQEQEDLVKKGDYEEDMKKKQTDEGSEIEQNNSSYQSQKQSDRQSQNQKDHLKQNISKGTVSDNKEQGEPGQELQGNRNIEYQYQQQGNEQKDEGQDQQQYADRDGQVDTKEDILKNEQQNVGNQCEINQNEYDNQQLQKQQARQDFKGQNYPQQKLIQNFIQKQETQSVKIEEEEQRQNQQQIQKEAQQPYTIKNIQRQQQEQKQCILLDKQKQRVNQQEQIQLQQAYEATVQIRQQQNLRQELVIQINKKEENIQQLQQQQNEYQNTTKIEKEQLADQLIYQQNNEKLKDLSEQKTPRVQTTTSKVKQTVKLNMLQSPKDKNKNKFKKNLYNSSFSKSVTTKNQFVRSYPQQTLLLIQPQVTELIYVKQRFTQKNHEVKRKIKNSIQTLKNKSKILPFDNTFSSLGSLNCKNKQLLEYKNIYQTKQKEINRKKDVKIYEQVVNYYRNIEVIWFDSRAVANRSMYENLKTSLQKFNIKIRQQQEVKKWILYQIFKNVNTQYIIVFNNSNFSQIVDNSFFPFNNCHHYFMYCGNTEYAEQNKKKFSFEEPIFYTVSERQFKAQLLSYARNRCKNNLSCMNKL